MGILKVSVTLKDVQKSPFSIFRAVYEGYVCVCVCVCLAESSDSGLRELGFKSSLTLTL